MKRKTVKILILVLILFTVFASTGYAKEYRQNGLKTNGNAPDLSLSPSAQRHARAVKNSTVRGSLISTALLDITNAGGGNIDILIETLAHKQCDEIFHTAYLERWDEEHQDWGFIDSFDFTEHQTDNPDEILTALTSVVTVKNQPAGYYYRVQGYHMVIKGNVRQSFSTHTDGVLITSEP